MINWIIRWKWCWFALITLAALSFWWQLRLERLERAQDQNILAASRKYHVDPALIKAVIWQESRFDPNARGTKEELGLMQIGKSAASDWAKAEKLPSLRPAALLEPARNVHVGAWYLGELLRRYTRTDHPFAYALADYNAGRTAVLRWSQGAASTNSAVFLQQMDYPGTRRYISSILGRYPHYQAEFAKALAASDGPPAPPPRQPPPQSP